MADQETEGFQVIDKRRLVTGEDQPAKAEESREQPEAPGGQGPERGQANREPAGAEESAQQMSAEVPDLLAYMLSLLGAAAWQWMGLIANPVTRRTEVDLSQARLAIDTFEDIARRLYPYLDEEANRQIRQTLTDLRVNFLERSKGASQG